MLRLLFTGMVGTDIALPQFVNTKHDAKWDRVSIQQPITITCMTIEVKQIISQAPA
jgi:hypothetical protein